MQYVVTVTWDIDGTESATEFFALPSEVAYFVRGACLWQGMVCIAVSKVRP